MQQRLGQKLHATSRGGETSKWPFYLVMIYLVLEYGRPQSWIKPLGVLHMSLIVGILLIISLARMGSINLKHPQSKLYILLLVLMAAHIPFAVNNFWAFMVTQTMLMNFVVYLSIIHFVDTFEKYKKMMAAWIWIHLFLAISGIIRGGKGVGGFMADENDFALVLNMAIPFSFFMGMVAKKTKEKTMLFFTTGVLLLCVTATLSRGGFLGMTCVGGFCWLKSPRKVLSLVLAVVLLCTIAVLAPENWYERIGSIADEASDQTGTAGQRLYTWGIGWEMFLDHPIVGVGPGNYSWNAETYEPPGGLNGQSFAGRAAHSLYFTLLPELGLTGFIIFLLILKASWKDRKMTAGLVERFFTLNRKSNPTIGVEKTDDYERAMYLNLALSASVIAYLVTGTFISVLYYPSLWLLIGFQIALRNVVEKMDATVPGLVPGVEGIGRYPWRRVFPQHVSGVAKN